MVAVANGINGYCLGPARITMLNMWGRMKTEITREEVLGTPSGRIEEALAGIAGFQQFRRSDSRSSNPTAQGVTLRALGGNATSRALVSQVNAAASENLVDLPAPDPDDTTTEDQSNWRWSII